MGNINDNINIPKSLSSLDSYLIYFYRELLDKKVKNDEVLLANNSKITVNKEHFVEKYDSDGSEEDKEKLRFDLSFKRLELEEKGIDNLIFEEPSEVSFDTLTEFEDYASTVITIHQKYSHLETDVEYHKRLGLLVTVDVRKEFLKDIEFKFNKFKNQLLMFHNGNMFQFDIKPSMIESLYSKWENRTSDANFFSLLTDKYIKKYAP